MSMALALIANRWHSLLAQPDRQAGSQTGASGTTKGTTHSGQTNYAALKPNVLLSCGSDSRWGPFVNGASWPRCLWAYLYLCFFHTHTDTNKPKAIMCDSCLSRKPFCRAGLCSDCARPGKCAISMCHGTVTFFSCG